MFHTQGVIAMILALHFVGTVDVLGENLVFCIVSFTAQLSKRNPY